MSNLIPNISLKGPNELSAKAFAAMSQNRQSKIVAGRLIFRIRDFPFGLMFMVSRVVFCDFLCLQRFGKPISAPHCRFFCDAIRRAFCPG